MNGHSSDIPRVQPEHIIALLDTVEYVTVQPEGTTSTFCHAYLPGTEGKRFFLASGHSGCVMPALFNAQLGIDLARSKAMAAAKDKLWELAGFVLFNEMNKAKPTSNLPAYQQRVIDEQTALTERMFKLHQFFNDPVSSNLFGQLDPAEQSRLRRQYDAMGVYSDILEERISNFPKEPA